MDCLRTQLHVPPLGKLRTEDDEPYVKPWKRYTEAIKTEDVPSDVIITLADRLYIPVAGFNNRAQNELKRLAAFRNPQYYRSQAMRMPVWNIPRVICCAEYQDDYLVLPRGCFDDVVNWMQQHHVYMDVCDECAGGRSIDVVFNGTLREEQAAAFEALSAHDTGILSATTAFGKTVIGAALVAGNQALDL